MGLLYGNRLREGVWEVWCAQCGDDMGTMKTETVVEAIRAKGEVCCPECNKYRCKSCNQVYVFEDTSRNNIEQKGICVWCEMLREPKDSKNTDNLLFEGVYSGGD